MSGNTSTRMCIVEVRVDAIERMGALIQSHFNYHSNSSGSSALSPPPHHRLHCASVLRRHQREH